MADKRNVSVIIVDDDYIARLINKNIVESFEQFEVHVDEAVSGIDALDIINKKYKPVNKFPNIIILDCAMPVMSGFDFIEAFKLMDTVGVTNIIIVTASDNPEDIQRARAFGIKYFLTKPLTFDKLKSAILETIG